jgi:hypothetical protein
MARWCSWTATSGAGLGERWRFDDNDASTDVHVAGTLVLHDRLRLHAAHGDLAARPGRFDVLAPVVLAGGGLVPRAGDRRSHDGAVAGTPAPLLMSAAALRGAGAPCGWRPVGRAGRQRDCEAARVRARPSRR